MVSTLFSPSMLPVRAAAGWSAPFGPLLSGPFEEMLKPPPNRISFWLFAFAALICSLNHSTVSCEQQALLLSLLASPFDLCTFPPSPSHKIP